MTSGAPISVFDSFEVVIVAATPVSGAPISVIDWFEVSIVSAVTSEEASARGAFNYSARWFNTARNFF